MKFVPSPQGEPAPGDMQTPAFWRWVWGVELKPSSNPMRMTLKQLEARARADSAEMRRITGTS